MTSTVSYLKEWQKALQAEIQHLKKYGSTKYQVMNGRLLNHDGGFTYYFDSAASIKIPNGSIVSIVWGSKKVEGRILSSEGRSVIVALDEHLGDLLPEAYLVHDPWELLDQLYQRLDEAKKSKRKRARMKKLMDPSMEARHPTDLIKTPVHELILRSKYNPVTFVWGPPGTGKTYTLARVVANKYFKKSRILVLAHSNQAVDVLMAEISSFVQKKERFHEGDLLRYGSQVGDALLHHQSLTTNQLLEKHHPDLFKKKESLAAERQQIKQDLARSFSKRDSEELLELETKLGHILEKIRQKEIQFVKEAKMIGTTLAKAANDPTVYEKEYDLVVLDEASMAYVPQTAFAASLAKRVIICGDFKQLPPIASARHPLVNEWLREDVFHKAGVVESVEQGELHQHLFLLKEQRRMHPDISSFTNKYIYNSLVGDHESVKTSREAIVSRMPFANNAALLLDTSYTGEHCMKEKTSNSRINLWQLFLSFQLIHESYLAGTRSIGYVTPYRAQAVLMEHLVADLYRKELQVADIISATVHRFQGSERDVMIFDTVDSFPQERAGMLLTGKESERLLNVAITRTRGKFIHVSNTAFVRQHVYRNKTLRKLVDHQTLNNQDVLPKDIGTWIKNQHPHLQWMHARKLERVFKDIHQAKRSIVISLPKAECLSNEWIEALNNRNRAVELTVISSVRNTSLQIDEWIDELIPFPFVLIDTTYLWLGLPLETANGIKPPYVAARLDSSVIGEYFLRQLPIGE